MCADELFSDYYADLLEGRYDCVDRLVVNAYFAMGQTGGGMRAWWRRLHGDDSKLDNNHLRDMAGTFSRRIHAFCDKHGTPLVEAQAGERKHELAEQYLPSDPNYSGLFLVITANAAAPVWDDSSTTNRSAGPRQSNPAGRPPGTTPRAKFRKMVEADLPEILAALVAAAKAGDVAAAKLIYDHMVPTVRPSSEDMSIRVSGNLRERGEAIVTALCAGKLTPESAMLTMNAMTAQARLIEQTEVVQRIAQLEALLCVNAKP